MILDICCIIVVLLLIGIVFMMATALDKINKQLKDLKDNQFDVEQVLKMYEMKFNRPIITQEKADIQCLYQTVEIPYGLLKDIKEGRISEKEVIEKELIYKFSKMILPYIEYETEIDCPTMSKVVKGRLRVIKKDC